jgi:thioredoxin reductase
MPTMFETCTKVEAPVASERSAPNPNPDVVVVGAGPYGLSLGAHLRANNVNFRIFGNPMHTWREQMPKAMFLKSDGFASNLSDPARELTLKKYCAQRGINYDDKNVPVNVQTFSEYGLAFQNQFVPNLENKLVAAIDRLPDGTFHLRLDSGEELTTPMVVLAVGISHFQSVPEALAGLPHKFVSHSSANHDVTRLRGKDVAIIGGGSSAADLAAQLIEDGAKPTLVARRGVRFHGAPTGKRRSFWKTLRHPSSGIGPGWKSRFFTDAPILFHYLPENYRLQTVRTHLGPAAGWFVKEKVIGRVPILNGYTPMSAQVKGDKVSLTLQSGSGDTKEIATDHIICATGYRVDLKSLGFLGDSVQSRLQSVRSTPVLSSFFESSVSGLFFLGVAAANSFGPLMRFAYGAEFAVRRITPKLVRRAVARQK